MAQIGDRVRNGAGSPSCSFGDALRITRVQGYPGVWEMSWASDGRADSEHSDKIRGERQSSGGASGRTTSLADREPGRLKYLVSYPQPWDELGASGGRSRMPQRNRGFEEAELAGLEPASS